MGYLSLCEGQELHVLVLVHLRARYVAVAWTAVGLHLLL